MKQTPQFLLTLIILVSLLTGCASQKAIPLQFDVASEDQFTAVNLDVNAGNYVSQGQAEVANYIYHSFGQSGLFSDISTSLMRWPYTISLSYSWEQPMGGEEFAGTMLSASTLLLIPAYVEETHTVKVEILKNNELVKQFRYEEQVKTALSLYHDPIEDRKNGINRILERLFTDMKTEAIIPTVSDLIQAKPKHGGSTI